MKRALLLHNPGAGDEEHSAEELRSLICNHGFECIYLSIKDKEWKDFDVEFDILVIAGGDGTVRKVAKKLLTRKVIDKSWPIGLLPYGTANNIAKTLEIDKTTEAIIQDWQQQNIQKFDVGRIENVPDAELFLESLGYGVFPYLMTQMKEREAPEEETPEEKIKAALKFLHQIILTYPLHYCKLNIDGKDYSGQYLLLEVMNTKSIGPNLFLAPDADPGDGMLEVVAVTNENKDAFESYVSGKLNGEERPFDFTHFRGKNISLNWEGTHVHVDDEVIKIKKEQEVKVELKEGLLEFLVSKQ